MYPDLNYLIDTMKNYFFQFNYYDLLFIQNKYHFLVIISYFNYVIIQFTISTTHYIILSALALNLNHILFDF